MLKATVLLDYRSSVAIRLFNTWMGANLNNHWYCTQSKAFETFQNITILIKVCIQHRFDSVSLSFPISHLACHVLLTVSNVYTELIKTIFFFAFQSILMCPYVGVYSRTSLVSSCSVNNNNNSLVYLLSRLNTSTASLQRGKTPTNECLDMTLKNLMARFQ